MTGPRSPAGRRRSPLPQPGHRGVLPEQPHVPPRCHQLQGEPQLHVGPRRRSTSARSSSSRKKIFSSSACDGAPAYRPYAAAFTSSVRNSTGIAANYDRPASNQPTATKPLQIRGAGSRSFRTVAGVISRPGGSPTPMAEWLLPAGRDLFGVAWPVSAVFRLCREFHQTRTRDGLLPRATMAGIAVCAELTVAADSRQKFRERLVDGLAAYLKVPVWPGVLLLQSHPMRKNRIGCDCV